MQLGVTPIVSTAGALPEFQPQSEKPIGVDDVEGLATAFDSLADPMQASVRGAACREHYVSNFSASVSAPVLHQVLVMVTARQDRRHGLKGVWGNGSGPLTPPH
jgi:hypothetical protein